MQLYTLTLGQLGTNCYIAASSSGNCLVIDAPDDADAILEFIREKNLTVSQIVLTHGHFDHILALTALHDATGAPIAIHENGAAFLKDGINNLCHYAGIPWRPVRPQRLLHDGDAVILDDLSFRVLYTPGHTADCICLYTDSILFSGDTLFCRSIGRTDHPTGDMQQEIASVLQKLMPLPDETKVYPGHGPSTTIGEERRENPYLQ